jgi:hypothetical protein
MKFSTHFHTINTSEGCNEEPIGHNISLPADALVLVVHADLIDALLTRFLQVKEIQYSFYTNNTAVTHLEFDIKHMNSDEHPRLADRQVVRVRCANSAPVDVESHALPSDETGQ